MDNKSDKKKWVTEKDTEVKTLPSLYLWGNIFIHKLFDLMQKYSGKILG